MIITLGDALKELLEKLKKKKITLDFQSQSDIIDLFETKGVQNESNT